MKRQSASSIRLAILLSFFLVSSSFFISPASAQAQAKTQKPASDQKQKAAPSPEAFDISITANVSARELSFEIVPNASVEFTSSHKADTIWTVERENLPSEAQPGVVYRDIHIRLKITSLLADIDKIVSEALGETPVSDDQTPAASESPKTPQAPPKPKTRKPNGGAKR